MKRTPLANLRDLVWNRADGRCEAQYEHGYRCRNRADELHHRLPRRPGGTLADFLANEALKAGTFSSERHLAHLIALCQVCHHEVAHGQPVRAVALGLRVPGEMRHERWSGESWYFGPDDEFAALWPKGGAA